MSLLSFIADQSFFKKTPNILSPKNPKKQQKSPPRNNQVFEASAHLILKIKFDTDFFNITLAAYSDHQAFQHF